MNPSNARSSATIYMSTTNIFFSNVVNVWRRSHNGVLYFVVMLDNSKAWNCSMSFTVFTFTNTYLNQPGTKAPYSRLKTNAFHLLVGNNIWFIILVFLKYFQKYRSYISISSPYVLKLLSGFKLNDDPQIISTQDSSPIWLHDDPLSVFYNSEYLFDPMMNNLEDFWSSGWLKKMLWNKISRNKSPKSSSGNRFCLWLSS